MKEATVTTFVEMRKAESDRLEQIRDVANMNQSEFAKFLDIEPGSYSDIKRGKNGISRNIQRRLEEKLNINLRWLIYNEGEMLLNKAHNEVKPENDGLLTENKHTSASEKTYIEQLFKIIDRNDETISFQQEIIRKQLEQIDELIRRTKAEY